MSQGFTNNSVVPTTVAGSALTNQWLYLIVTANMTISAGNQTIEANAVAGSFTILMPASPTAGMKFTIVRGDSSPTYTVTIDGNGHLIGGTNGVSVSSVLLGRIPASLDLQYNGTIWRII